MRFAAGKVVGALGPSRRPDSGRIEHDEVRGHSRRDAAPVAHAEKLGGVRRHAAHRFFEREHFFSLTQVPST